MAGSIRRCQIFPGTRKPVKSTNGKPSFEHLDFCFFCPKSRICQLKLKSQFFVRGLETKLYLKIQIHQFPYKNYTLRGLRCQLTLRQNHPNNICKDSDCFQLENIVAGESGVIVSSTHLNILLKVVL